MMKLLFVILLLLLFPSCVKKNGETEAPREGLTVQATPVGEAADTMAGDEKTPIQLGNTAAAKTRPSPRPNTERTNQPLVNIVQDNMEKLLLNSSSALVKSSDMDIGILPGNDDDPVRTMAADFLKAVFQGRDYHQFVHEDFKAPMRNIVSSVRDSLSVTDFRYGLPRHHGNGYIVPFRVFADNESGIGSLYLSAIDGSWFVQDMMFDVETVKERGDEQFSPSLYRWMEVY